MGSGPVVVVMSGWYMKDLYCNYRGSSDFSGV
jgi:hypothetical protein